MAFQEDNLNTVKRFMENMATNKTQHLSIPKVDMVCYNNIS